jgi:O-antigen/teichoic acid export membrane protein
MQKPSIKTNFTLNLTNTVAGLLYPVITFPYISRILLPEGIGLIQFLQSVISYFAMFAALGIPLYAVKEIAKVREDVKLRNQTTIEILCLHLCLTLAAYAVLLLFGFTVDKFTSNLLLYLILSVHLFLDVIGCEWFYQGIEDFKYITIRSLLVRLFSLIALFVFVRSKTDIYIYAILIILAEAGNFVFNFYHLRKYVNVFSPNLRNLNLKRHIKPALEIFMLNIIISIYINLDSVMLGFFKSNADVGYYAAATRIVRAMCGFSIALGAVVFPRLTSYYNSKEKTLFYKLTKDSLSFSMLVLVPLSVMVIITAPVLIPVFCGSAYNPSILTIQILAPIMIFLGISGIMGTKVLYAMDYQRIVIICTGFGAVSNFILNLLLIPYYSYHGAAVASLVAEFLVSVSMLYYGYKLINVSIFDRSLIQTVIGSLLVAMTVIVVNRNIQAVPLLTLIIDFSIGALVYLLVMMALKNENLCRLFSK